MNKRYFYSPIVILLLILCHSFVLTYGSVQDTNKIYENLRKNLDNLFTNKNLKNTKFSVCIYSISRNELIYSKDADLYLTPASCTKLVTTFAIYNQFQTCNHIETNVYYDGNINKDGILEGNLYIVGRGDALFNSSDLDAIVEDILKYGIKQIKGNIYADVSYFDSINDRFIYSGDLDRVEDLQPITPLSIDRNIATIIVSAGNHPSKSVNVQIIPSSPYFVKNTNVNIIKTQRVTPKKPKGKRKSYNYFDILPNNDLTSVQYISQKFGDRLLSNKTSSKAQVGISITSPNRDNLKQIFYIKGSIRANSSYSYRHHIHNPPLAAAGALKHRLETAGIKISGIYDKIDTLISYHNAKNLISSIKRDIDEMINLVNKNSDNYVAENLFKIIGAESYDIHNKQNQSKSDLSKESMLKILRENGIKCENCIFNDGSGLSRRNKINSKELVDLLIKAYNSNYFDRFYSSLAIAGIDGTLIKRMKLTKAENNLRGKTGTHRNVSALAGYINTFDGELIAFSIIFNGGNVGAYKAIENQVGVLLSEFSYSNEFSGK